MKCGKNDCEKPHGPYYYAYWKERIFIDDDKSATCWKTKKKYVGVRSSHGFVLSYFKVKSLIILNKTV